jgi:hypothetical protein
MTRWHILDKLITALVVFMIIMLFAAIGLGALALLWSLIRIGLSDEGMPLMYLRQDPSSGDQAR